MVVRVESRRDRAFKTGKNKRVVMQQGPVPDGSPTLGSSDGANDKSSSPYVPEGLLSSKKKRAKSPVYLGLKDSTEHMSTISSGSTLEKLHTTSVFTTPPRKRQRPLDTPEGGGLPSDEGSSASACAAPTEKCERPSGMRQSNPHVGERIGTTSVLTHSTEEGISGQKISGSHRDEPNSPAEVPRISISVAGHGSSTTHDIYAEGSIDSKHETNIVPHIQALPWQSRKVNSLECACGSTNSTTFTFRATPWVICGESKCLSVSCVVTYKSKLSCLSDRFGFSRDDFYFSDCFYIAGDSSKLRVVIKKKTDRGAASDTYEDFARLNGQNVRSDDFTRAISYGIMSVPSSFKCQCRADCAFHVLMLGQRYYLCQNESCKELVTPYKTGYAFHSAIYKKITLPDSTFVLSVRNKRTRDALIARNEDFPFIPNFPMLTVVKRSASSLSSSSEYRSHIGTKFISCPKCKSNSGIETKGRLNVSTRHVVCTDTKCLAVTYSCDTFNSKGHHGGNVPSSDAAPPLEVPKHSDQYIKSHNIVLFRECSDEIRSSRKRLLGSTQEMHSDSGSPEQEIHVPNVEQRLNSVEDGFRNANATCDQHISDSDLQKSLVKNRFLLFYKHMEKMARRSADSSLAKGESSTEDASPHRDISSESASACAAHDTPSTSGVQSLPPRPDSSPIQTKRRRFKSLSIHNPTPHSLQSAFYVPGTPSLPIEFPHNFSQPSLFRPMFAPGTGVFPPHGTQIALPTPSIAPGSVTETARWPSPPSMTDVSPHSTPMGIINHMPHSLQSAFYVPGTPSLPPLGFHLYPPRPFPFKPWYLLNTATAHMPIPMPPRQPLSAPSIGSTTSTGHTSRTDLPVSSVSHAHSVGLGQTETVRSELQGSEIPGTSGNRDCTVVVRCASGEKLSIEYPDTGNVAVSPATTNM